MKAVKFMSITVQKNIPLAPYTTLQVGGEAAYFVSVKTEEELSEAVAYAKERMLPIYPLGGGSNVLIADKGLQGLLIHIALTGRDAAKEGEHILVTAQAGESLDDVVAYTVQNNWWGIENLSHIPGTVGATPIQNVGAYGVEASDVITAVRVFNTETERFEELSASDCAFAYRDSLFKTPAGKKYIVTAVTYALSQTPHPRISYRDLAAIFEGVSPSQKEIREAVMKIRAGKFPDWKTVGTAGSFFKNPIIPQVLHAELLNRYPQLPSYPAGQGYMKISLGWVLDKVLGLRGFKKGNISTYKNQALVIIAEENATASEIEMFAHDVVKKIKDEIGIDVEWEVTLMK